MNTHACRHTQTRTHTLRHTHTNTCLKHTQTNCFANMKTHFPADTNTHGWTHHNNTQMRADIHTPVFTRTHPHKHSYSITHSYKHTDTHTQTCSYWYTHTPQLKHTHTHTHTSLLHGWRSQERHGQPRTGAYRVISIFRRGWKKTTHCCHGDRKSERETGRERERDREGRREEEREGSLPMRCQWQALQRALLFIRGRVVPLSSDTRVRCQSGTDWQSWLSPPLHLHNCR
jgi:hypothetical protein